MEGATHAPVGLGAGLDLDGVERSAVFDQQVDLFLRGVSIEVQRRHCAPVLEGLDDLADYEGFEELAAACTQPDGVGREPLGQPGHQAGIPHVELGCLDGSLQVAVVIGRQQVDDARSLQHGHPALGGVHRDAGILGHAAVIEQFCTARRHGHHEACEIRRAADVGQLAHVALDVGGHVGCVIDIPVHRLLVQAWHVATMDGLPDVRTGLQAGFALLQVVISGNETLRERHTMDFPQRQTRQIQHGDTACQALAHVLHEPEGLRAGQQVTAIVLSPVDVQFQQREQGRHVLHLVQDQAVGMVAQEKGGVVIRLLA